MDLQTERASARCAFASRPAQRRESESCEKFRTGVIRIEGRCAFGSPGAQRLRDLWGSFHTRSHPEGYDHEVFRTKARSEPVDRVEIHRAQVGRGQGPRESERGEARVDRGVA